MYYGWGYTLYIGFLKNHCLQIWVMFFLDIITSGML